MNLRNLDVSPGMSILLVHEIAKCSDDIVVVLCHGSFNSGNLFLHGIALCPIGSVTFARDLVRRQLVRFGFANAMSTTVVKPMG